MYFSPRSKCISSPRTKVFVCRTIKHVHHLFGRCLKKNLKKNGNYGIRFVQNFISFKEWWSWKRTEKGQRWECKKTTGHLLHTFANVWYSLLVFFHLYLVSVLSSAPSILKWNEVLQKFFRLVYTVYTWSSWIQSPKECSILSPRESWALYIRKMNNRHTS